MFTSREKRKRLESQVAELKTRQEEIKSKRDQYKQERDESRKQIESLHDHYRPIKEELAQIRATVAYTGFNDDRLDIEKYDFLDFGTSRGGSIDYAINRLGGTRGLGIDLSEAKVADARANGVECVQGDVTNLDLPDDSVRFVTMLHLLEHLPDFDCVNKAIATACRVSTDFVYIVGPYFEADDYLKSQGLKFYWSDWRGHTFHLKYQHLDEILKSIGQTDYVFFDNSAVPDSSHPTIHPLESPIDQHDYDPATHPEKPELSFPSPLYREMVCCIKLKDFPDWELVQKARSETVPYIPNPLF